MLSFYKQQPYFSQIVSKKAKTSTSFFMKYSKNNNIILGFSFMYFVQVYPKNRTFVISKVSEMYLMSSSANSELKIREPI